MFDFRIILLICIVFISTVFISTVEPNLHKLAIIEGADFVLNENSSKKVIVSQPQVIEKTKEQEKIKEIVESEKIIKPTKKTERDIKNPEQTKKESKKVQNIPEKIKENTDELTEEEEIIAWNKWRSDLQNQVMKDSKIRAPLGTAFKFSFTVDKNGRISNIKTWSLNPNYTAYAVRIVKPILSSYQSQPILNFPARTKRVIVNVEGGFVVAPSTKYSSPSDYSDYERVK